MKENEVFNMSLPLKDENGNAPSTARSMSEPSIADRIFIEQMDRSRLFPCSNPPDKLAMPVSKKSKQNKAPKPMNQFMVFRRQVAFVAEEMKLPFDGKNLSLISTFIWREASKKEKQEYVRIANILKKKHQQNYPNYNETRKRRRSRTGGNTFVHYRTSTIHEQTNKDIPFPPQLSMESGPVNVQSVVPTAPTPIPTLQNVMLYNYAYYNNNAYYDNNPNCDYHTFLYELQFAPTMTQQHQQPHYNETVETWPVAGDPNAGFDGFLQ